MDGKLLIDAIEAKIPGAQVDVKAVGDATDHFETLVISETFDGKSMVECHREVMTALGPLLAGPLHAIAIKTLVRKEESNK